MRPNFLMRCPDCSNVAWRNGYRKLPTNDKTLQIWKCSECERQFTNRSNTAFNRMRYPKKIILYAVIGLLVIVLASAIVGFVIEATS